MFSVVFPGYRDFNSVRTPARGDQISEGGKKGSFAGSDLSRHQSPSVAIVFHSHSELVGIQVTW